MSYIQNDSIRKLLASELQNEEEKYIYTFLCDFDPVNYWNWNLFVPQTCPCGESVTQETLAKFPEGNGHCPYCYALLIWVDRDEILYHYTNKVNKLAIPTEQVQGIVLKITRSKTVAAKRPTVDIDSLLEEDFVSEETLPEEDIIFTEED